MSFLGHGKIYRSALPSGELSPRPGSPACDHRFDESSTGYSLASCTPALLASASPAFYSFYLNKAAGQQKAANGNLSPISLSHPRGALQALTPV